MTLSRLEKQVARIAVEMPRTDPVLQLLLRLADLNDTGHIGLSMSIVTSGKLMRGNLMGAKAHAEKLDQGLQDAMTGFAADLTEDDMRRHAAEEWRDAIAGSFTAVYQRRIDEEREHEETLERIADERDTDQAALLLDDLPDETAEVDIALNPAPARTVLSLDNAVLVTPPVREEAIGIVRIPIAQIGAWWLGLDSKSGESDTEESSDFR